MIKFKNKEYDELSTIRIEFDNRANLLTTKGHEYVIPKVGVQTLDIRAKDLHLFEDLYEDKADEYEICVKSFEDAKTQIEKKKASDRAKEQAIKNLSIPQKRFQERTGRSVRPLRSLKVVSDLGVAPTDENLKWNQMRANDQMAEMQREYFIFQKELAKQFYENKEKSTK